MDSEFATVEDMPTPRSPGSPGRGRGIIPISLGIVSQDEGEVYVVLEHDVERAQAAVPWLVDNVYPWLPPKEEWVSRDEARAQVEAFFEREQGENRLISHASPGDDPELWAFWIGGQRDLWVLRSLFDEPPAWMESSSNLREDAKSIGFPAEFWPPQPERHHDALADAYWDMRFARWTDLYGEACDYIANYSSSGCVMAAPWRSKDSTLPEFGWVHADERLIVRADSGIGDDQPVIARYDDVRALVADWRLD